ncbi:MAG: hypothetical protein AAF242_20990, partial [Bacteroidota bacterium]
MASISTYNSSYQPQLMVDGKKKPIAAFLNEMQGALENLQDSLMIQRRAVGISHASNDQGTWFSEGDANVQYNGIYVP